MADQEYAEIARLGEQVVDLERQLAELQAGLQRAWRVAARAQRGGAGVAIVELEPLLRALLEPWPE